MGGGEVKGRFYGDVILLLLWCPGRPVGDAGKDDSVDIDG